VAQCIDIRRQGVSASDTFLLDTNVAIDIATPLSPKATVRQRDYSKFIERALTKGAGIAVAVLSFFEMSNVLERQVFESEAGRPPLNGGEIKKLRSVVLHRRRVVETIDATWTELRTFAAILQADISSQTLDEEVLPLLRQSTVDGYDPAILLTARRHGISTIITHDGDFASVPNIIVLTANDRLL